MKGRGAASRLSLKARAIQWLARREHSRLELRRKLLPWAAAGAQESAGTARAGQPADGEDAAASSGAGPISALAPVVERGSGRRAAVAPEVAAQVEALLDWLEAHGYLSDARFVESRIRVRASRLGTARIRQELSRLGAELPAQALHDLKHSEASRAADLWQRKFGEPAADAAGRARQMRFLAARGFDAEVVRRVVPVPRRVHAAEPEDE